MGRRSRGITQREDGLSKGRRRIELEELETERELKEYLRKGDFPDEESGDNSVVDEGVNPGEQRLPKSPPATIGKLREYWKEDN